MSRSVTLSHSAIAARITSLVASSLLVGDPLFDLDRIEAASSATCVTGLDRFRERLVAHAQLVQSGHALHAEHLDYFGVAHQGGAFSLHWYFLALIGLDIKRYICPIACFPTLIGYFSGP